MRINFHCVKFIYSFALLVNSVLCVNFVLKVVSAGVHQFHGFWSEGQLLCHSKEGSGIMQPHLPLLTSFFFFKCRVFDYGLSDFYWESSRRARWFRNYGRRGRHELSLFSTYSTQFKFHSWLICSFARAGVKFCRTALSIFCWASFSLFSRT